MPTDPKTLAYVVPWSLLVLATGLFLVLGPVGFTTPWALIGLLGLPLLWLILRVLPPIPKLIRFPPIRLLLGLQAEEQTPHTTPPWLILLRVTIAGLIILAFSGPVLNPSRGLLGNGPVLLVVDNSWAAAKGWANRQDLIADIVDKAERDNRPVALLPTVSAGDSPVQVIGPLAAGEARSTALALTPMPLPADHGAALDAVDRFGANAAGAVIWLADGIEYAATRDLIADLELFGPVEVRHDADGSGPLLLREPQIDGSDLKLVLERRSPVGRQEATVRALAVDGRLLTRQNVYFDEGDTTAEALIDLPLELRNRLARLVVEGEASAGAVFLVDERSRRRPVGLVAPGADDSVTPLLDPFYYLNRAMEPYAEVSRGSVIELLQRDQAMLVLVDEGPQPGAEAEAVNAWMERGGLVLRFAGPKMARRDASADQSDLFVPVQLRRGGRALGGVLLWGEPAKLAAFDRNSPFSGLDLPDDVTVSQQVLAEPALDLADKTWARLADGTPLVTAERRGDGWLVLVHITANSDWSNLPLSGLFVDMLRRLAALGQGVAMVPRDTPLAPVQTLDGFGRLAAPPVHVRPVTEAEIAEGTVSAQTPPGYYGQDAGRRALNLGPALETLKPLEALPDHFSQGGYAGVGEVDLRASLFTTALLLFLADCVIGLMLRGLAPKLRPLAGGMGRAAPLALLIAAALVAGPRPADAQLQGSDQRALESALWTRLAYIRTGVPQLDAVSQAGLTGLSRILSQRTAVEPIEPIGLDPARDELSFYSLIYWPLDRQQAPMSAGAIRNLTVFMKNGGTIFFDTRDGEINGEGARRLREISQRLPIPPLQPVPRDHVLTRSFYLLQEFPGRWASGDLWIEPVADRVNDGVSSVIVGANDYAAAWAVDEAGRPQFPVVPGGTVQREMAFRVGVNLMMFALTGSYKADQVHVPSILERLGQ